MILAGVVAGIYALAWCAVFYWESTWEWPTQAAESLFACKIMFAAAAVLVWVGVA